MTGQEEEEGKKGGGNKDQVLHRSGKRDSPTAQA